MQSNGFPPSRSHGEVAGGVRIVFSDASSLGVADVTRELLWMSGTLAQQENHRDSMHVDSGDSGLESDTDGRLEYYMFSRCCRHV